MSYEPASIPVNHCPACRSGHILDTGCKKKYYLINLDQTVEVPYAVCQECQLIFQHQYVGDEFLNHYYKQSPMLRRSEPTAYEVDQNHRQAAFLARNLELKKKRVVEIGAEGGAFLVHLNKHFDCETYFNELSEEAQQVLSAQPGLRDFRSVSNGTKMDLVVLRHVLEHILDLDQFLNYVKSITSENGYLFVEVPDWSYLDSNTDPLIFEHIHQFSTHNLVLLLRRTGWQCEAIEKNLVADDPATPNRVQRLLLKPAKIPNLGNAEIAWFFKRFLDEHFGDGNRAIDALVERLDKNSRIALYPASHLTFSALLETRLREANVVGMFDIDAKKHGKVVDGIKVFPAANLKEVKPDLILLFTMAYEREIRESFDAMGLTAEVISITQLLKKN